MDLDQFYKKLSLRIKYFRKIKKLTQEKLAEKADISLDYMGKIERNINKPGLISILKIINALDISISEFFKSFS